MGNEPRKSGRWSGTCSVAAAVDPEAAYTGASCPVSSSFEFVPMIRGFSRRVLSRVGLPTAVPDRAMPADDCRVRLPEVEPSLGASVRPGFKAPCREYCDAFSVENVIFLPREDSGTMREVYENHRQPLGIDDQPLAPTVSWPGPAGSSTTGLHFQAERSRARPKPTRLRTLTHPVSLSK